MRRTNKELEPTILLVEDNDLDVENLERCLRKLKINNPIIRAKDGLEGLNILRSVDPETGVKRPCVVLLDLNMPRMNGIEFLEALRRDDSISNTPVFVLTTSDHHQDIHAAHRHNVCGYIVKPLERSQMIDALNMLNSYWRICKLPTETRFQSS